MERPIRLMDVEALWRRYLMAQAVADEEAEFRD